jgi:hypothetical protein
MTAQFLGGKTLGSAMPDVNAAMGVFLNNIQPQITAAVAASARLTVTPPSIATNLVLAEQIVAALQVSVTFPGVDFQLAALADLIATLSGQIAAIAALQTALGVSIDLWAYTGPASGVSLEGQVAPDVQPNAPTGAIILTASTPATRAVLGAFFNGAPIT